MPRLAPSINGSTAMPCRGRSTRFPASTTRISSQTGFPGRGTCWCSTIRAVRGIRLPNGNTLITEGMHGRIFQVTPSGAVVWEYLTPYEYYAVAGEPEVKVPTVDGVDRPTLTRMIYRSQAVPFEWVPADTPRSLDPVDRRAN